MTRLERSEGTGYRVCPPKLVWTVVILYVINKPLSTPLKAA